MMNSDFIETSIEWPTWLAIVFVYSSWWYILVNFEVIPLAPVLLTVVLAFHGSVQHELMHGHPTKSQTINDILAYPPVALWYPYSVYKNSHLLHHKVASLTMPVEDPESFYLSAEEWDRDGTMRNRFAIFNMTLLGRLLLGPLWSFVGLKRQMIDSVKGSSFRQSLVWTVHELLVLILLLLVGIFFEINVLLYILCAYLAQSLNLLRSFYEHRAAEHQTERSVIMNTWLPMRLLYLNNNYHLVHHERPDICWYNLHIEYKERMHEYKRMSGGYIESGYSSWFKKYLFKPVDHPKHKGFSLL
jgi:fatty acid desaturase